MKYRTEITVNLPLAKFIEKLDKPENMQHWQKGLTGYNLLSGTPGSEGAQMELHYTLGKRKMVLIETIIKRNLPHEFHATYDTKGVHNIQKNYFKEVDAHTTHWVSDTELKFSGVFLKLMALFAPGVFKKQSRKYAEDFKAFAEKGISVAGSKPINTG